MGKKGRKFSGPKDPFDALPVEFKDAMGAAQPEELVTRLADVSKEEERNQAAMKADGDLKSKRADASYAAQSYRDQSKINKLKTKFIIRVQSDRGDVKAGEIQRLVASKV